MTLEQANAQFYFRIRLYVDDVLVAGEDAMYYNADGVNSSATNINLGYVPKLSYQGDGLDARVEAEGTTDEDDSGVYRRWCRVFASKEYRAVIKTSFHQMILFNGDPADFPDLDFYFEISAQTIDTKYSHVPAGQTVQHDIQGDFAALLPGVPSNTYNVGGCVEVYLYPVTHLPLHEPRESYKLINGGVDGIIRDA